MSIQIFENINFIKYGEIMSFSVKAKTEVAKTPLGSMFENIAELSALIKTSAQLEKGGDSYKVRISTEIQAVIERAKALLFSIFNEEVEYTSASDTIRKESTRYTITLTENFATKVLTNCYVIRKNQFDGWEQLNGVSRFIVYDEITQRAYVRGVFLGCASANITIDEIDSVKKHRGGYHLEFVFDNKSYANDFMHIMSEQNITLKMTLRKYNVVCYLKEIEAISDLLALVGASNAVLVLQNELAIRQVRNNLNRQLNCACANISKSVDASMRQLDAISKINQTIGLENLPDHLQDLCLLRLANPEASFDELVQLTNPPLTKSGINHRFRKIIQIADEIKEI